MKAQDGNSQWQRMTEITDFDSFLQVARQQQEPQRLLLVFVKVVLPEDADEQQVSRYHAGGGGALVPLMYVDKAPDEIASFEDLLQESRQMADDWQMVLAAALSGRDGQSPAAAAVEQTTQRMIRTIHAGGDLSGLLVFDRDGDPVQFI